jgi:hypothetical protein
MVRHWWSGPSNGTVSDVVVLCLREQYHGVYVGLPHTWYVATIATSTYESKAPLHLILDGFWHSFLGLIYVATILRQRFDWCWHHGSFSDVTPYVLHTQLQFHLSFPFFLFRLYDVPASDTRFAGGKFAFTCVFHQLRLSSLEVIYASHTFLID